MGCSIICGPPSVRARWYSTGLDSDGQGLKFEVLEGARDTIRAPRERIRIVFETHPAQWADAGIDQDDAHEVLALQGFRARAIDPGEPLFAQGGHVVLEPLD